MIAIYARQSKDKKDSLSIDSQIEKCASFCTYKEKEYKIYSDKGFSGKNTDRHAYNLMLQDIKKGLIDEVVVYQLSRISRNLHDFINMVVEYQKYNVTIASATESLDNSTPMGRAMINILMVFAQLEREQTGERIKDNVMYRATQGRFLGGTTPYGYDSIRVPDGAKTKPMLIPNKNESKIVKDIYKWYLEDVPLRNIAHKLNALGIFTKNNKKWSASRITILLKSLYYCKNEPSIYDYFENSKYVLLNNKIDFNGKTAMNYYKKRIDASEQYVIVSEHEGLIDADTWIKVQGKFGKKINRSETARRNLLNGLIKCGYCGKSLNLHGGKYMYFKCKTREDFGPGACPQLGTRADKLESEVIDKLINICTNQKYINMTLAKSNNINNLSTVNDELQLLNNNLKQKNIEVSKVINFLKSSDNQKVNEIVNKELSSLSDEITDIENKINIVKLQKENLDGKKINKELIFELFKSFPDKFKNADFDTKRKLIKELVELITIKDKLFKIKFYKI